MSPATRDGSAAGINVKTALDSIVHLDYGTCPQTTGRAGALPGRRRRDHRRVPLLEPAHLRRPPINTGNFDDLTLNTGSVLRMAYLVDTDEDGLFDVQENLYGTDLDNADTDGDGLTDFAETQTGWTVPAIGRRRRTRSTPAPWPPTSTATPPRRVPGATTCGLAPMLPKASADRPEPARHQR